MPQIKEPEAVVDLSTDIRWQLVQEIVASPLFSKPERLSGFLLFVCKLSLEGKQDEINEQAIGSNIFERPVNYDAANDNIVRIHAARLRQRLKQYFESPEGLSSPFTIDIPKGGYVPIFRPQESATLQLLPTASAQLDGIDMDGNPELHTAETPLPEVDEPGADTKDPGEKTRRKIWRIIVPAVVAVSLCWTLISWVYLLSHPRGFKQIRAVVFGSRNPLWDRLFRKDRNTLIVTADSSLVLLQNLSGKRISLAQYVEGGYSEKLSEHGSLPSSVLEMIAARRYTSIVDVNTVQRLLRIPGLDLSNTQIRYSRDLHANDLKDGNLILLGTYESTPWVQMIEPRMNFYFENNLPSPQFAVINRHPQAGEQERYIYDNNDPEHKIYAVVAFQPTVNGSGDALILEGQTMAGTAAATDFVFNNDYLIPFLNTIKRPDGAIPHFEVLIASKGLNGDASRLQILAYRIE